jgi:hypothetical protein
LESAYSIVDRLRFAGGATVCESTDTANVIAFSRQRRPTKQRVAASKATQSVRAETASESDTSLLDDALLIRSKRLHKRSKMG